MNSIPSPVPGLLIVRDEGRRESWTLTHGPSGAELIYGLAGLGSATGAARDMGMLIDWDIPGEDLLAFLEECPKAAPGTADDERIATRWGGSTSPSRDGKAAA